MAAQASAQVVIKVLRIAPSDALALDVSRQTKAAADLHQSHIIPYYGVAQDATTFGVVMAYAPGGSLGDTLAGRNDKALPLPLDGRVVARLVTQIARALSAAHAAGLTHGDLKPNNIFVRTSPSGGPFAVISDFGQGIVSPAAAQLLASDPQLSSEQATWAQQQLRFAAPEQLAGTTLPASDQYALAALAYLLLTGQAPQRAAFTSPSQLNPALPAELDMVFRRALAPQPEQRYPDLRLFAAAFDEPLAVAAGSSLSASAVTREFARLSGPMPTVGERRATAGPRPIGDPARSASRAIPAALGQAGSPSQALALPADTSPNLRRPLAIATGLALLIALLTCALSLYTLNSGPIRLARNLSGFTGPNVSTANPTATIPASQQRASQQATSQLAAVTTQAPVFSDPLTGNSHHWATQGTAIYFGADQRLHLSNQITTAALTVDDPSGWTNATGQGVLAQADVTMVNAQPGDLAGLRFLVSDNGDGTQSYYAYFISAENRYELWLYQPGQSWTYLASGYTPALKPGLGVTNRLAALVDSQQGDILLFANGQFVAKVALSASGPITGATGLIVLNNGAEAAFSHYAVYPVNG